MRLFTCSMSLTIKISVCLCLVCPGCSMVVSSSCLSLDSTFSGTHYSVWMSAINCPALVLYTYMWGSWELSSVYHINRLFSSVICVRTQTVTMPQVFSLVFSSESTFRLAVPNGQTTWLMIIILFWWGWWRQFLLCLLPIAMFQHVSTLHVSFQPVLWFSAVTSSALYPWRQTRRELEA